MIKCLAVGLSECGSGVYRTNSLPSPVRDVVALVDWLKSRGIDLNPNNTRMFMNERATFKNISDSLEWLSDADLSILLYSGHGTRVQGFGDDESVDNCLVLADFDWNDRSTMLVDDMLYSALCNQKVLAIIDCCHSGSISKNLGINKSIVPPPDIAWSMGKKKTVKKTLNPNYCWLSACSDEELALDMGDLSLLTKSIVDSSGDHPDMISLHKNCVRICQGNQTPQIIGNYEFMKNEFTGQGISRSNLLGSDLVRDILELKEQHRIQIWQELSKKYDPKTVSDMMMKHY